MRIGSSVSNVKCDEGLLKVGGEMGVNGERYL